MGKLLANNLNARYVVIRGLKPFAFADEMELTNVCLHNVTRHYDGDPRILWAEYLADAHWHGREFRVSTHVSVAYHLAAENISLNYLAAHEWEQDEHFSGFWREILHLFRRWRWSRGLR